MRPARLLAFPTLCALAACSAGTEQTSLPPPPPSSAPASLTIAAGDAQTATPGSAVAVKPSVQVRDARGNGVSGVSVAFVVEAGSGSVQQTSVQTGTDGTASPGDWTLGASEGENRLRATSGSLSPVVLTAQGRYPVVALADTTIGAGGGTIRYRKSGDPLDGLELRIPSRAYAGSSRWVITARPSQAAPTLRFGEQVGSVLEIVSDQSDYADSLLELQVPHQRKAGEFAMLFGWDKATGQIEALPLAGETANTLTAVSRHFNPSLLATAAGPASLRATAAALPVVGGLQVFIAKAPIPFLEQPITTGFQPGVDDWEFPNYGSYMEPYGHCSGQSVTAMWYFVNQKASHGPLYESLDKVHQFWPDNPLGYRFASWAQASIDWYKVNQSERQMAAIARSSGVSAGRLYFYTLAFALRVTNKPQFVGVSVIDANGNYSGHALVGYATERTKVWVADPNFPGQQRGIVFLNDQLGPYPSRPNANAASDTYYDQVSFQSMSFILPLARLAGGWGLVQQGTMGHGWFPDHLLQYHDTVTNVWRTLMDTLTTYQGELTVRNRCATCTGRLAGAPVPDLQPLVMVDGAGTILGYSNSGSGLTVPPLSGGTNRYGVYVMGLPFAPGTPRALEEQYLHFRWIAVTTATFGLTPAHTTGRANSTADFVAHPKGVAPPGAHYVWDFGDQTAPLDKVGDSTASHQYTANGFYRVQVSLEKAGRRYALSRATVLIGNPITIDPNPAGTSVNTQLQLTARSVAAGTPAPMRYSWDFGDGKTMQVLGDSVARHTWTTSGTYSVSVLMKDPATGDDLGHATGQVIVADDVPVWRITGVTLTSLTGVIPHDSMANHPEFVGMGNYFRERRVMGDIDAGRQTAYVHALNGQLALPDCYDFDFDGDKQESITWPAWIWIQFPSAVTGPSCGDRVLGHYPWASPVEWWLGIDQRAYFQRFQNSDIGPFDYPQPETAVFTGTISAGSLTGRAVTEWTCCARPPRPNSVYGVKEVTATIAGVNLTGQLTFIYFGAGPSGGLPLVSWKAVYSFDAVRGR